jgi:hypothetical protein
MEIILSTKKTIKNTFTFDNAVAKEIADSEQSIAQLQNDNKLNTESKNGLKLRQYAELIPMLAKAEYLKKNKFFMPQVRKEVDLHLDQTCKVSKASRKRLIENTNAFIRTVVDPKPQGSNFTAEAFKEWCKDNSVNSETKLKKKITNEYKPTDAKDIFANQIVGTYTYKKNANGEYVKSGNFTPSKFSIDEIDEIINHLTAEKNKRDIRDKNDQNSDQIEDTENDTIADNISSIGL